MAHTPSPTTRPRRAFAVLALVVALAAFPLGTAAIHQFSDVPDSNQFHNDIDAIADAGVTTGCGAGVYCPSAYVTREQMAAFMNRLGALASDKTPVVNATTVDRFDANELVRFAYASDDSLALVSTNGNILQLSITAPSRGWLHIVASSDTFNLSQTDAASCNLDVDGINIAASRRTILLGPGNTQENCSTNAGYRTCGGTHTVTFEASEVDSDTTTFDEASLEVLFVPFNGVGNLPSLILCVM